MTDRFTDPASLAPERVGAIGALVAEESSRAETELEIAEPDGVRRVAARSPTRLAVERLVRDRAAMIAFGVVILVALLAICAPLVAILTGHPPNTQYQNGTTVDGLPEPPSLHYLLGTDDLGRDLLVRIAYGAQVSLLVGVVSTLLTVAIGAVVGLLAGYFGGVVDTVLSRLVDIMLAIPFLLFAISLASVVTITPLHFGPITLHQGIAIVVLVIGIFSWSTVARIVRGQVLAIKEKEYIEAARSLGASAWRVLLVDVVPNVVATVIVYASLLIPLSIVAEATLSFLGVGVPPPTADWGAMIADAVPYYQEAWWYVLFPSLALLITTVAFNVLGDGIRDAFDPRASRLIAEKQIVHLAAENETP
jgi:ABC-type dipeptide/oligopeptide/nickel transport system permease subunit